MPTMRQLTDEEVTRLLGRQGGPRVDLTPYLNSLSDFAPGDWGLVELERYESVPTIKRRMTTAAKQQGKRIVWKRRRDEGVPFEVRAGDQPSAQSAAAASGKRAGGRGESA